MHIHRALLYALIVLLCVKLLARFSSTPVACGIACLLYAIDDAHAYSSGWISAANTLLACVFGLFALLMHDHWRRKRSNAGLVLSLVAFVLSLLSSEGGLALMGYLVAYALFLESGSWKKRIATLIPATLIAAGYLVFYLTQHLGVKGSFDYLSPTEDLGQTALIVLSGTVTGTLSQVLSIPFLAMALQMAGGVIVAAVLLAAVVAVFWRFLGSSRTVAFFGAGMVLSIVPFAIGMMGDRYLLWAGLGAAGLLGELFAVYTTTSKLQRITAKTLLATNTIVSLIFFVPTLFWLAAIENNIRKLENMVTSEPTVMLNGHTIADNCAAAIRSEKHGQWPEHFYHLYEGLETLTVKRTGERTLRATLPRGWFSSSFISRGARPQELYFKPGQTFELQLMTATIEEVTPDGRPRSVSFAFKRDLSELAWLQLSLKGPKKIQVPALGEEIRANPWSY
jgi:MFS family permease